VVAKRLQNAIGPAAVFAISGESGTFTRDGEFVDSIPGFSGLGYSRSAPSFLEGGNGILNA